MTKAQRYYIEWRDEVMQGARWAKEMGEPYPGYISSLVSEARLANHQAIHVARLTRARQARP